MINLCEDPPEFSVFSKGERPWLAFWALEAIGLLEATGGLDAIEILDDKDIFEVVFVQFCDEPMACWEPEDEFKAFCALLDDKGPGAFCCDKVRFRS